MSVYDSLFAEIDNNINWIVLTNDKSMFAVIKKQLRDLQKSLDAPVVPTITGLMTFDDAMASVSDVPIDGLIPSEVIIDEAGEATKDHPIDIATPALVEALTEEPSLKTARPRGKKTV